MVVARTSVAAGARIAARIGPPPRAIPAQPPDACEVCARGREDRDARVGVVHPAHRNLVDLQPAPLGAVEQLGVEEPAVVLDLRQQRLYDLAPRGLEAT